MADDFNSENVLDKTHRLLWCCIHYFFGKPIIICNIGQKGGDTLASRQVVLHAIFFTRRRSMSVSQFSNELADNKHYKQIPKNVKMYEKYCSSLFGLYYWYIHQ